jgi:hypothetical protein
MDPGREGIGSVFRDGSEAVIRDDDPRRSGNGYPGRHANGYRLVISNLMNGRQVFFDNHLFFWYLNLKYWQFCTDNWYDRMISLDGLWAAPQEG